MDVAQGGREERRMMRQRGAGFTARAVSAHFGFVFKAGPIPLPTPPSSQDPTTSRAHTKPTSNDHVADTVGAAPISTHVLSDQENTCKDDSAKLSTDGQTTKPTKRKAVKKRKALFTKKRPTKPIPAAQRHADTASVSDDAAATLSNNGEQKLSFRPPLASEPIRKPLSGKREHVEREERPGKRMKVDTDTTSRPKTRDVGSDDEFRFKRVSRSKPLNPGSVERTCASDVSETHEVAIFPARTHSKVSTSTVSQRAGSRQVSVTSPDNISPHFLVKVPDQNRRPLTQTEIKGAEDDSAEPEGDKPRKRVKRTPRTTPADTEPIDADIPEPRRRVVKKSRLVEQPSEGASVVQTRSQPVSSATRKVKRSTRTPRPKETEASATRPREPLAEQSTNSSSPHKVTTTEQTLDACDIIKQKPESARGKRLQAEIEVSAEKGKVIKETCRKRKDTHNLAPVVEAPDALALVVEASDARDGPLEHGSALTTTNDTPVEVCMPLRRDPMADHKIRTKKLVSKDRVAKQKPLITAPDHTSSTSREAKSQSTNTNSTKSLPDDPDGALFAPMEATSNLKSREASLIAHNPPRSGHQATKSAAKRSRLQLPEDDLDLSEVFDGIAAIAASSSTIKVRKQTAVSCRGRARQ